MKWSLLYSLDQHGASLTTLYRQCRPYRGPCILAIKDADDSVSGSVYIWFITLLILWKLNYNFIMYRYLVHF